MPATGDEEFLLELLKQITVDVDVWNKDVLKKSGQLSKKNVNKLKKVLRRVSFRVDQTQQQKLLLFIFTVHCPSHVSTYNTLCSEVVLEEAKEWKDLPVSTFLDENYMFSEDLSHVQHNNLCQMMHLLTHARPDLVYVPWLYPLSCLLLEFLPVKLAYDMMEGLLLDHLPHYMPQTLRNNAIIRCYVLPKLLQKHRPSVYNKLLSCTQDPDEVLKDWFFWIFRDLPLDHRVHILNCYLFEGPKVLYRVSMAILQLFFKTKQTMSQCESLSSDVSEFCKVMKDISPAQLLKVAFKIRRFSKKSVQEAEHNGEEQADQLQGVAEKNNAEIYSAPGVNTVILKDKKLWQLVWSWLPTRHQVLCPRRLYCTEEDGTSLATLFSKCEGQDSTLLIIKTTNHKIFGAYCSADWANRRNLKQLAYFGTGETFVFTLTPEAKKYPWVDLVHTEGGEAPIKTYMFQSACDRMLQVGGGGGVAIQLDGDLNRCHSDTCSTFQNPPLTGETDTICSVVEVFGFD